MGKIDDYPDLLSVEQAAEILGLSTRTIYRRVRSGHIPASRIPGGQELRIHKEDLLASLVPVEPKGGDDG